MAAIGEKFARWTSNHAEDSVVAIIKPFTWNYRKASISISGVPAVERRDLRKLSF
jgi:hypothetical protein